MAFLMFVRAVYGSSIIILSLNRKKLIKNLVVSEKLRTFALAFRKQGD